MSHSSDFFGTILMKLLISLFYRWQYKYYHGHRTALRSSIKKLWLITHLTILHYYTVTGLFKFSKYTKINELSANSDKLFITSFQMWNNLNFLSTNRLILYLYLVISTEISTYDSNFRIDDSWRYKSLLTTSFR